MAKAKKKGHQRSDRSRIMGRSDIPYAERIALQRQSDIVASRNHAAKITMYCMSVAMYELYGVGYKRLVRFSLKFKECIDEFYDDPELSMAHAQKRLEQIGVSFSGFFTVDQVGRGNRTKELFDHSLQASQIAMACGAITMNDELGYGQERQTAVFDMVEKFSERYAKEGVQFLLNKMRKIGFPIVDGVVMAYTDDNGNPVTPSQALKE